MAFSRLLAFASSARPADMVAVPAVATTARTAIHLFTVLVNFLNVYSIRSSLFGPGEIALGAMLYWSFGSANAVPAIMTHGGCLVLQESFEATRFGPWPRALWDGSCCASTRGSPAHLRPGRREPDRTAAPRRFEEVWAATSAGLGDGVSCNWPPEPSGEGKGPRDPAPSLVAN